MRKSILITFAFLVSLALTSCDISWFKEHETIVNKPQRTYISAQYFDGEYYGDHFSPGVGNYYIHISTRGFTESGNPKPNAAYYRIDLYGALYKGENTDIVPVPDGTYKLDKSNTHEAGTFSLDSSKYLCTDGEGYFDSLINFDSGVLEIKNGYTTLTVLINNIEHIVTCSKPAVVADKRSDIGNTDTDETLSTLTEDYTVNLSNHDLLYAHYGYYYRTGLHNWIIAIWPKSRKGDYIQFDIMTEVESSSGYNGTFTVGDTDQQYSFLKGGIGGDSTMGYYLEGSWYYTDTNSSIAPFVDGTLTITTNADSSVTAEFSVIDDRGNTISGNWSGHPKEYN